MYEVISVNNIELEFYSVANECYSMCAIFPSEKYILH